MKTVRPKPLGAAAQSLILSPEEEFALTLGEHGHPETEGYGKTSVSEIKA